MYQVTSVDNDILLIFIGYCSPAIEFTFQNPAAISTELPGNAAGSTGGASVPQPKRAAWACCDDCQKWRCIPSELADVIGENRWYSFSSCYLLIIFQGCTCLLIA